MIVRECAMFAIFCCVSLYAAASTNEEHNRSVNFTHSSINAVRRLVEIRGSAEARAMNSRVNFIVDISLLPYAASIRGVPGGNPKIRFSTQYRIVLAYLTELGALAAIDSEYQVCDRVYGTYLYEQMANNSLRSAQLKQPLDIESPEDYGTRVGGACSGLQQKMPLNAQAYPFVLSQIHNALAFVYLHELGHLVLGHRGIGDEIFNGLSSQSERMKAFLEANVRSQQQEMAADAWATRELIRIGATARQIINVPLLRMLLASSGLDCLFREGSSHPMATERFAEIARIVLNSGVNVSAQEADVYSDLIRFNQKVEKMLQCN